MRKAKLEEQKDRLHKLSRYYASSLVESASLYGEVLIADQVPVMEEIINHNKQLTDLSPFIRMHWNIQKNFLQTQKIDPQAWMISCKTLTP